MSRTKKTDETAGIDVEQSEQSVVDGISDTVETVSASTIKINTVATAAVKSSAKMNVHKFLMLYPQDPFIETLLKLYYPKSFFTKEQWFECIQEILNTPIVK